MPMTIREGVLCKYLTRENGETAVIPADVTEIDSYAFFRARISAAALPEGLQTIRKHAFYYCTNLLEIVLPHSLQRIEAESFLGSRNLYRITVQGSPRIENYAFAGCISLKELVYQGVRIAWNDWLSAAGVKNVCRMIRTGDLRTGVSVSVRRQVAWAMLIRDPQDTAVHTYIHNNRKDYLEQAILAGDTAGIAAFLEAGLMSARSIRQWVTYAAECGQTAITAMLLAWQNSSTSGKAPDLRL